MVAIRLLEDMITPDQQPALQRMYERKSSIAYTDTSSPADRKKIYRTIQDDAILFIKDLLAEDNLDQFSPQGITYSNDEDAFSVVLNNRTISINIELESPSNVSLSVTTQSGLPVSQIYSNQKLSSGAYSESVNIQQPGIYMVSYIVNGRIYDRKVNIN